MFPLSSSTQKQDVRESWRLCWEESILDFRHVPQTRAAKIPCFVSCLSCRYKSLCRLSGIPLQFDSRHLFHKGNKGFCMFLPSLPARNSKFCHVDGFVKDLSDRSHVICLVWLDITEPRVVSRFSKMKKDACHDSGKRPKLWNFAKGLTDISDVVPGFATFISLKTMIS